MMYIENFSCLFRPLIILFFYIIFKTPKPFKRIVQPEMNILSSFDYPHIVRNPYGFFLMWNTKEVTGRKKVLSAFFHTVKVNGGDDTTVQNGQKDNHPSYGLKRLGHKSNGPLL